MGRSAPPLTAILLDTHAWVWWLTRPDHLSRAQSRAIGTRIKRGAGLLLSIISCWEVALLSEHGRFLAPGHRDCLRLSSLRDPADMLIVATAQHHGAALLTSDTRIAATGVVTVVA